MKKKIILMFVAALTMTSCSVVHKTATTRDVTAPLAAAVISDLDVANQKVTYTLVPTKKVRKGGLKNCINTAISEALANNGGGDVLIETQEAIVIRTGLWGRKIKSVTVTGYPAKYKNFRAADEETVKAGIISGSLVRHEVKRK